jgi:hypothetical protein
LISAHPLTQLCKRLLNGFPDGDQKDWETIRIAGIK